MNVIWLVERNTRLVNVDDYTYNFPILVPVSVKVVELLKVSPYA